MPQNHLRSGGGGGSVGLCDAQGFITIGGEFFQAIKLWAESDTRMEEGTGTDIGGVQLGARKEGRVDVENNKHDGIVSGFCIADFIGKN